MIWYFDRLEITDTWESCLTDVWLWLGIWKISKIRSPHFCFYVALLILNWSRAHKHFLFNLSHKGKVIHTCQTLKKHKRFSFAELAASLTIVQKLGVWFLKAPCSKKAGLDFVSHKSTGKKMSFCLKLFTIHSDYSGGPFHRWYHIRYDLCWWNRDDSEQLFLRTSRCTAISLTNVLPWPRHTKIKSKQIQSAGWCACPTQCEKWQRGPTME